MKFINRGKELKAIKEKLEGPGLDFYVIYGRRRIGKTTLSLASVKGKEFVYYLATEENNLKKLKEVASRVEPRIKYVEEDLEAIFNFFHLMKSRRVTTAISDSSLKRSAVNF
ncbi:MAG: ATP-binding protein [Halobacteriota archaeon]